MVLISVNLHVAETGRIDQGSGPLQEILSVQYMNGIISKQKSLSFFHQIAFLRMTAY